MKTYFTLKDSEHCKIEQVQNMNPKLILVLGHLLSYCENNQLDCKITNITGKFAQSVSSTHPTGRAFDLSVRGWEEGEVLDCVDYISQVAGHLGAISSKTMQKRVAYYHDVGLGKHIHFQVFK